VTVGSRTHSPGGGPGPKRRSTSPVQEYRVRALCGPVMVAHGSGHRNLGVLSRPPAQRHVHVDNDLRPRFFGTRFKYPFTTADNSSNVPLRDRVEREPLFFFCCRHIESQSNNYRVFFVHYSEVLYTRVCVSQSF